MTKQEHELMLALFATQMQVWGMILQLLESRGIAETGDIGPFAALASEQLRGHVPQFHATYSQLAKQVGVELPVDF